LVAARAVQTEAVLDAALMAIKSIGQKKRDPLDVERALWMLVGASVVGASGALLLIGSPLAAPTFLLSCALQATHFLILSPQRYDVEYPVEPEGRKQSLKAFLLYAIVTVFVWWASLTGHLKPIFSPSPWPLITVGLLWFGASAKAFHWLLTLEHKPSFGGDGSDDDGVEPLTPEEQAQLEQNRAGMRAWADGVKLIFAPSSKMYSLFDAATGEAVDFYQTEFIGLDPDLQQDLLAFTDANEKLFDRDDPLHVKLIDDAQGPELTAQARRLFERVKANLGDKVSFQEQPWENKPSLHPAEIHFVFVPYTICLFESPDDLSYDAEMRPFRLGLSRGLIFDFETWNYSYYDRAERDQGIYDETIPPWTREERTAHENEARALCARLVSEFRATGRGHIPVYYHPPAEGGEQDLGHTQPELIS
jgi:hypothetical protein